MPKLSNKLSWFEKAVIGGILLIIAYIPFHAVFSVAIGSISSQPLLVKAWKEILLGLLVILCVFILLKRPDIRKVYVSSRLNQLALAFVLFQMLLALFFHASLSSTIAGLAIDIRFAVFFLVVRLGILLLPSLRRLVVKTFLGGAVISVVFGLLQQYILPKDILSHIGYSKATIKPYLTVDNNPAYIRINSTLRGPNPLGAYVVIILSVVAGWFEAHIKKLSKKWLTAICLFALGCLSVLYASYSRSAWIALVVAALVFVVISLSRKWQLYTLAGVVVLLLVGTLGYPLLKNSSFFHTVIDHKDPNNPSLADSNLGHETSVISGIKRAVTHPLGFGIGSTGSASLLGDSPLIVENQYLFVAHESGWVGVLLFIALQVGVLVKLYWDRRDWLAKAMFTSGVGMVVIGLLLPVFTDDTTAYVWWGLAAVALVVTTKRKKYGKSTK